MPRRSEAQKLKPLIDLEQAAVDEMLKQIGGVESEAGELVEKISQLDCDL